MAKNGDGSLIRAVVRAAEILDCFSADTPELGVSAVSKATGLDKGTVSRILATLAAKGLVRTDTRSGKYRIGPRILALAQFEQEFFDVRQEALPHLRWLWQQTGETVRLNVVRDLSWVCIEQIESRYALRRVMEVGRPVPLHCGASGRLLLAFQPPSVVGMVVDAGLEPMSEHTVTDPDQLRASLEQIRAQGYALSSGEREPGGVSLAVPVRDYTGRVVAALSVSLPETRFLPDKVADWLADLAAAAGRLSAALGYRQQLPMEADA